MNAGLPLPFRWKSKITNQTGSNTIRLNLNDNCLSAESQRLQIQNGKQSNWDKLEYRFTIAFKNPKW